MKIGAVMILKGDLYIGKQISWKLDKESTLVIVL